MFIRVVAILIFLTLHASSTMFEQNGVKKGNSRISLGISQEKKYNDNNNEFNIKTDVVYGRFLSDNSEVSLKLQDSTDFQEHIYKVDVSYNYYFLKQPTLTPYVSVELGIAGDTQLNNDSVIDEEGVSIGMHHFFTETLALTLETGVDFTQLKTLTEQYTTIRLTYFFN